MVKFTKIHTLHSIGISRAQYWPPSVSVRSILQSSNWKEYIRFFADDKMKKNEVIFAIRGRGGWHEMVWRKALWNFHLKRYQQVDVDGILTVAPGCPDRWSGKCQNLNFPKLRGKDLVFVHLEKNRAIPFYPPFPLLPGAGPSRPLTVQSWCCELRMCVTV